MADKKVPAPPEKRGFVPPPPPPKKTPAQPKKG
jgi:hypothetical protein